MNENYWLSRTELQLGKEKLDKLINKNVLVVGLGGVGAYAAEMLCRSGIQKMTIIDGDKINPSNKNRQLLALDSTIGQEKTLLMSQRLKDINPEINLNIISEYIRENRMKEILTENFDYVVDAIDTLSPKIHLIYFSLHNKLKIVSSMGAGGRLNADKVMISDISDSYNCKLASALRKRLHRMGIYNGFKVVFSPEKVSKNSVLPTEGEENKKSAVGTISYMPAIFGCFCVSVVIKDLLED